MERTIECFWKKLAGNRLQASTAGSSVEHVKRDVVLDVQAEIERDLETNRGITSIKKYASECRKICIIPTAIVAKAIMHVKKDHFNLYINEPISSHDASLAEDIIAHEVGHTFMFDIRASPMVSHVHEIEPFSFCKKMDDFDREDEILASNIGKMVREKLLERQGKLI